MTENRKNYVDYIKAIGMILVILGHINSVNSEMQIKQWIYSFHMPLFFFASGLLLKKQTFDINYIEKKFKSLLVPYLLWALIYSALNFKNILYILYGSYSSINKAESLSSLWFLPTMFLGIIMAQIIINISKNNIILICFMVLFMTASFFIPVISSGYPLCIDVSLAACSFILLGYIFDKILFANKNNKYLMIVLTAVGFIGTMLFRLNYISQTEYVVMATRKFGNPAAFLITAVSGCVFIYGLCKLLDSLNIKFLSYIGMNTIAVLCVQKPIIAACEAVFKKIKVFWFVELIGIAVIVVLASCVLIFFINRYVPVLNGKWKNNKSLK